MPRPKKASSPQQAVVPTTALVASSHRFTGKTPRIYAPSKEWQKRTYHHFKHCGEARFAARYFGHAMSRAVLYTSDAKGKRQTAGRSTVELAALFSGPEGQAGMLESVGVHLVVAGECYLVGRQVNGADIWEVVSVLEIEGGPAGWKMLTENGTSWEDLDDDAVIIRVWVPLPDRRWEADSPFRSLLPVLDEIERLTRYIHAQTISRLTGAGLLVLPDTMTFPPAPTKDGQQVEYGNDAEAFMAWLGETMMESLKGDGSASEMVPGVLSVDADSIEKIQHLTFWTALDENARGMRQDAIHRFALGMDLPPEMVLGMGANEGTGGGRSNGVSHWGAWMLEEQAIKLHIEPMLDVLCAALTAYYLRPLTGNSDMVRADTSTLRLRPDRSQEALELADRGWLKPEVAIRENGFEVEDMMNDEERQHWLLMKVASGSATPEQVEAALRALGVQLDIRYPDAPGAEEPRETPQPPSLEEHPARPKTPEPANTMVYEALALRALERAGNRLRNMYQMKTPGKAYEAHTHVLANGSSGKVLEDAWGMVDCIFDDDPQKDKVVATLQSYCLDLIESQQPHTREALTAWFSKEGL